MEMTWKAQMLAGTGLAKATQSENTRKHLRYILKLNCNNSNVVTKQNKERMKYVQDENNIKQNSNIKQT